MRAATLIFTIALAATSLVSAVPVPGDSHIKVSFGLDTRGEHPPYHPIPAPPKDPWVADLLKLEIREEHPLYRPIPTLPKDPRVPQ